MWKLRGGCSGKWCGRSQVVWASRFTDFQATLPLWDYLGGAYKAEGGEWEIILGQRVRVGWESRWLAVGSLYRGLGEDLCGSRDMRSRAWFWDSAGASLGECHSSSSLCSTVGLGFFEDWWHGGDRVSKDLGETILFLGSSTQRQMDGIVASQGL